MLLAHQGERDAFVARAIALLQADEQVVAAWLSGSLGRGDADALSDIDLQVVVADEAIDEVCATRREYVARLAKPLLIQEAPQNAPPGGAYLLVLYGGELGPHQVDWHWQPQSSATMPYDVRVLFDRVGIPRAKLPQPFTAEERARLLEETLAYFWAMCPIAAKKIARGQPWITLRMFRGMRRALDEVSWLVGKRGEPFTHKDEFVVLPPVQPGEQLAFVRELAREMEMLAPDIEAAGGAVPGEVVGQVGRYFDFVSVMIVEELDLSNT